MTPPPLPPRSPPLLALASLLLLAAVPERAIAGGCQGALQINGAGSTSYVTGGGVHVSGGDLTLKHNSGVSVTSSCADDWDPHGFQQFRLLGQTLSYTIDLSRVGCACNVALYLIQTPAMDAGGNPTKGTCGYSPYYCDANKVCGQWCPELDIMEANSHTFAATPHKCDASPNKKYNSCDRGGRGRNTKDMPQSFGPGPGHTIDTTRPFDVKTSFHGRNGSSGPGGPAAFIGMSTTLQQGAKIVILENQAGPEYLATMAKSMDSGMSIRITYWGKNPATMDWLDGPVCGPQTCKGANAGDALINNVWIAPIGAPPPQPTTSTIPPTPAPTQPPIPVAPPVAVPPSPAPAEGLSVAAKGRPVHHIFIGSLLLLLGCGCLFAATAAHLRRTRAEEAMGSCTASLAEAGCRDCAADALNECQDPASEVVSSKVLHALQEHCWVVLEASIELGGVFAQHVRTACAYLCSVFGEFSQQTASNRAAFRAACERAAGVSALASGASAGSGRGYSVLQTPLEVGDVVTVREPFAAPGRFIGTAPIDAGTMGTVEQIEIDARGGSAVVRFDGHKGSFRLSAELLLNLQANVEDAQFRRRRDGVTVVAVVAAVALVALVALIWSIAASAAGGVASSAAPAIPADGCCSWQDHTTCGVTTDFCKSPQACEQSCLGKWIMPQ